MTKEIAKRGIKRAFRADEIRQPEKIKEIRVIGKEFDISEPRIK